MSEPLDDFHGPFSVWAHRACQSLCFLLNSHVSMNLTLRWCFLWSVRSLQVATPSSEEKVWLVPWLHSSQTL